MSVTNTVLTVIPLVEEIQVIQFCLCTVSISLYCEAHKYQIYWQRSSVCNQVNKDCNVNLIINTPMTHQY